MTEIELHSAGATVQHKSIFDDIPSYQNKKEITQQFRENWVIPYYFNLNNTDEEWIKKMYDLKSHINDDIILNNLGDFDWRTRSTGAYFAAITGSTQFTDIIGVHLLKSEVCYAGAEYAKTLTSFGSLEAVNYLVKYLEYYLNKPELVFDQVAVITALKWFDQQKGTNLTGELQTRWESFIKARKRIAQDNFDKMKSTLNLTQEQLDAYYRHVKYWNDEIDTSHFGDRINIINKIKRYR